MNEQILKLAEEAGASKLPGNELSFFGNDSIERFAFLIIRECMRQVEEQYKPVLEDEVMMKDTHWDGYVQCGVDSYVAIREHFYREEE